MTEKPDIPPVWVRAASEALQARGRADLTWKRNELRGGIDVIGAHTALPHLAPLFAECRGTQQQDALLRAAAITALCVNSAHRTGEALQGQPGAPYRLGHTFRALTRKRTGKPPATRPSERDSVARRLALLPEMDFDSAVETLSALLSFANTEGVPVNFYNLTETLFFWGDGLNDASMRTRNRILSDYFGATSAPREAL